MESYNPTSLYLNKLLNFETVQFFFLKKKSVDSTEGASVPCTQFFLLLAFYIVMVGFSLTLFVWFLLLNIILKRFIHIVACSCWSFILIAKWYSIT